MSTITTDGNRGERIHFNGHGWYRGELIDILQARITERAANLKIDRACFERIVCEWCHSAGITNDYEILAKMNWTLSDWEFGKMDSIIIERYTMEVKG